MKFETIKNKKYFLYVLIIGIILFITFIVSTSLAKYKVTQSIKIASGSINYSPSDLNIMSIYIKDEGATNYTNIDTIPESGYELNSEESYCEVNGTNINATITYDANTKALSITPLVNKGTKCYLYFDVYIPTASEQIIALAGNGQVFNEGDAGYRYQGKTVNNYVEFNNETWRILAIEEGSKIGLTSGEYYIKLIKEDSIGNLFLSTNMLNVWSTSTLYNTLNDAYLNRTGDYASTGLNSTARSQIVKANWYTNGADSASYTTSQFYSYERSNLNNYVNNYVGLMYPSDYGYAVLASSCSRTTNLIDYDKTTCVGNNWLYKIVEWSLTPYSSVNNSVFHIGSGGYIRSYPVANDYGVRPSVYLRSDISFVAGTDGSSTNMFKIA